MEDKLKKVTTAEIAELLGCHIKHAPRVLKKLRKDGIVSRAEIYYYLYQEHGITPNQLILGHD